MNQFFQKWTKIFTKLDKGLQRQLLLFSALLVLAGIAYLRESWSLYRAPLLESLNNTQSVALFPDGADSFTLKKENEKWILFNKENQEFPANQSRVEDFVKGFSSLRIEQRGQENLTETYQISDKAFVEFKDSSNQTFEALYKGISPSSRFVYLRVQSSGEIALVTDTFTRQIDFSQFTDANLFPEIDHESVLTSLRIKPLSAQEQKFVSKETLWTRLENGSWLKDAEESSENFDNSFNYLSALELLAFNSSYTPFYEFELVWENGSVEKFTLGSMPTSEDASFENSLWYIRKGESDFLYQFMDSTLERALGKEPEFSGPEAYF